MPFARRLATSWHQDVPGSRWFAADLHVHTLDDRPGARVRIPPTLRIDDPEVLRNYARHLLRSACEAGVHVLGLTPHSPKLAAGPESSTTWAIVDLWNEGVDDDGVPFREKVYAVFPGFEPNINDGGGGVHLLFLFDPEIGRERYLAIYEAIMDGRSTWDGANLRMTARDARQVLQTIDERRRDDRCNWDFLVLAPHFENPKGLLREVRAQVLEQFPADRLAGYELANEKLPCDFSTASRPGSFLLPFMEEHRQAFFHASDAYGLPSADGPQEGELGYRTTWLKLAEPRIEALRQAFIANECRLRVAYRRTGPEDRFTLADSPDALRGTRPWLRRLRIQGEAAFFGGADGGVPRTTEILLSPDLTCMIGGSMTGKSTLLDGLRYHLGAPLPSDERLRRGVEERARERFLAGNPDVGLDTPGRAQERPHERWPAIFFTQTELQRLAQDEQAIEEILTRLLPDEGPGILSRAAQLKELDDLIGERALSIGEQLERQSEIQQKLTAAHAAEEALAAFAEAGLDGLHAIQQLRIPVARIHELAGAVRGRLQETITEVEAAALTSEEFLSIRETLARQGNSDVPNLQRGQTVALDLLRQSNELVNRWAEDLSAAITGLSELARSDRRAVERRLAELGFGAERLAEFQTLSKRAADVAGLRSDLEKAEDELGRSKEAFETARVEREELTTQQRAAFDRIAASVHEQFGGRIRVRRIENGRSDSLGALLTGFRQRGITLWWNGLDPHARPSPEILAAKLRDNELSSLGVSDAVAARIDEMVTENVGYRLLALRSPDQYSLEYLVREGEYRDLTKLSGGRRVSLLLSLLLKAHDDRPLVIDQPEDELDTRFLWDEVLPALRRLKGTRQVVVATHNADVVVNADADLVVLLEADAEYGRVAVSGAIEEPSVRRAIVETVDGGEEAFALRRTKYGF